VAFFAALTRGPAQASVFAIYAAFAYHIGKVEIGWLAGAAGFLALPIGFTAGWLMDRFGRKRTMVPGFSGVAVSMVALALSAFWHLSFEIFAAMYLIGMAFQALTGGSVQTIGADVAPAGARGKFLGLWRFTGQGGTVISPIVFTALATSVSYGASFLFVAGAASVVSLLVARFIPETGGAALRVTKHGPAESPAEAVASPAVASQAQPSAAPT
jgi:MFS family permease